jgi:hypothetical protein
MADPKATPGQGQGQTGQGQGGQKPYTKEEQAQATRKMFEELAKMRGGRLILGCCTQGCCE